jgi:hypothetical protein
VGEELFLNYFQFNSLGNWRKLHQHFNPTFKKNWNQSFFRKLGTTQQHKEFVESKGFCRWNICTIHYKIKLLILMFCCLGANIYSWFVIEIDHIYILNMPINYNASPWLICEMHPLLQPLSKTIE